MYEEPSPQRLKIDILVKFVDENLIECCQELYELSQTGILKSGKIRKAAEMLEQSFGPNIDFVQRVVERRAIELFATGEYKNV